MAFDVMKPYGDVLDTTVRVVTWNVWSRFGPWEAREAVLLQTLRGLDPDIVCIQEAWKVGDDTQGARFAEALGMHHVQVGDLEYEGVISGQAVLSRWPITQSDALDVGEGDTAGGAMFARVDGPRGVIDVVSLILTWRMDHSRLRSDQLTEICGWAKELSNPYHPLFLCGDFNSTPDSDELRAMVGLAPVHVDGMVFYDAVAMRATGPTATFTERNPFSAVGMYPEKQLDHIFSHWPKAHGAGHPVAASIIGDEPVDGVWASDHFGVMADLRY